ncbi:hypothetical protein BD410DRAFT_788078 [Rickenella mellea]|uniref:Uncharacterized protein n=1 Tax=Rickenella mellea TaxID=50990 RepID=A0A4Y7Q5S1_9AGAM|nr:hypothetical protein BD410DRAFT_788078 [Rickenella mellea]
MTSSYGHRSRTRSESVPYSMTRSPPASFPVGLRLLNSPLHTHVSTFKSPEIQININSSSVRNLRRADQASTSLPVFGDHDHITGSVTLDPQNCAADSGRLTISIEGSFEYISPMSATKRGHSQITPGKHRHIFYRDSAVIPLYTASEPVSAPAPPRSGFRSAFAASLRRATSVETLSKLASPPELRSHSSPTSPSPSPKTFNFDFELPRPEKPGEELPSTFSASNVVSGGVRGRVYSENASVNYCVHALWEAFDGSGTQAKLEAPILFQPDTDFQSLDGFSIAPDSWSETALSKVDNLPIECAVTIPNPATFPRSSSMPYFVVFTTKPRSRTLAAEFMSDATIAVSLVRRVAFPRPSPQQLLPSIQTQNLPMTPAPGSPTEPSSANVTQASSVPSSPVHARDANGRDRGRSRLLKRVVRSAPPILSSFLVNRTDADVSDPHAGLWTNEKPLPTVPVPPLQLGFPAPAAYAGSEFATMSLSDSRTLHTDISVGFPKRPKGRTHSPNSHPSLESFKSLPDGLYKGSIPLQKGWFPTLQWHGLTIEYFIQVSVIFDSNEFRTRVPVRIY